MTSRLADPRQSRRFHFGSATFDPASGKARLSYAFDDGPMLVEELVFPWAPWPQQPTRQAAFYRALSLLHLIAGVSYYKAGLPPQLDTGDTPLDNALAGFLQQLYERGLAEFAHVNGLDLQGRIRFQSQVQMQAIVDDPDLPERALVAMGGGKDSLVSLEKLRTAGLEVQPICVGQSALIAATVRAAGLPLIQVHRTLAPGLMQMNQAGALNGHVPVTAINSAILLCAALLYGFKWVVFSNERSADEATLHDDRGQPVNHQYSKSLAFESALRDITRTQVTPGLEYFSLLRPMGELAVAKAFSQLDRYHEVFSSCNRNFHLDGSRISTRWCGDCPKCRFTTLALAPFLSPETLITILGRNLLDDPAQADGFRSLCALGQDKPFECVGTAEESRAALIELSGHPAWKSAVVVRSLVPEIPSGSARPFAELLETAGPHHIPADILRRLEACHASD